MKSYFPFKDRGSKWP